MSVGKFIIKRLLTIVPIFFIQITITFFLTRVIEGDPLIIHIPFPSENDLIWYHNTMELYGFNDPILVQYEKYLVNLIRGDWGQSYVIAYGVESSEIVKHALPFSIEIFGFAWLISFFFGRFFAKTTVFNAKSKIRQKIPLIIAIFGSAIPVFVTGLILQYFIFHYTHSGFPARRVQTNPFDNPDWVTGFRLLDCLLSLRLDLFFDTLKHYILPVLLLSFQITVFYWRQLRSDFVGINTEDYIRTARAKGCNIRQLTRHHVYPNARVTTISTLGSNFIRNFTNLIFIEYVFIIPGIGDLFLWAVNTLDYCVMVACFITCLIVVVILNFISDLLYVIVDPRIRILHS